MRLAQGIHRIGTDSAVNAHLIEEAREVTVLAAAARLVRRYSERAGCHRRGVQDMRALVLTHGHSDHLGLAERLRTERRIPVWMHDADAALARGEASPSIRAGSLHRAVSSLSGVRL